MKTIKFVLTALVLVTTFAFTEKPVEGYKVGDVATDFKLKNVNAIAHFTDWIVAHVHVGTLAWIV